MPKQISLPPNIYTIYDFFDKTKNTEWKENPFTTYKKINNLEIKIAKNISNLNFYQVDFPINKMIKPGFLIKYIKNIDYRNYYSNDTLFYKLVSRVDDNEWAEYELYNGSKNKFVVLNSKFIVIFYNENPSFGQDLSDTKYYHAFKILSDSDNYILRFEIVLNSMDMDQDIDIVIYLNMIIRLLKAVHKKFKQSFNIELLKKHTDDDNDNDNDSELSNILSSNYNSGVESETSNSRASRISKDQDTQTPVSFEDNDESNNNPELNEKCKNDKK
jgi:hypothetical protein